MGLSQKLYFGQHSGKLEIPKSSLAEIKFTEYIVQYVYNEKMGKNPNSQKYLSHCFCLVAPHMLFNSFVCCSFFENINKQLFQLFLNFLACHFFIWLVKKGCLPLWLLNYFPYFHPWV